MDFSRLRNVIPLISRGITLRKPLTVKCVRCSARREGTVKGRPDGPSEFKLEAGGFHLAVSVALEAIAHGDGAGRTRRAFARSLEDA